MVRQHGRKQSFPASHRHTAEMPRKQAFSQRPSHKVFGHPKRAGLNALSVDGDPAIAGKSITGGGQEPTLADDRRAAQNVRRKDTAARMECPSAI